MKHLFKDIYKIFYFRLWRMRSYEFKNGGDGVVNVSGAKFVGYESGVIATSLGKKIVARCAGKKELAADINVCIEVYRRFLRPLYDPLPVTERSYGGFSVQAGGIALEIGGYLGIHAIHIAKRWPEAEVHVFEAMPDNAEICLKNVELNGLGDRVHVHNFGVSSTAGSIEFERSARQGASYVVGVIPNAPVKIRVPTLSIDDFLAQQGINYDKIEFARVQVNGAEADVLKGMRNTLSAGVGRLVVTTRYDERAKREVLSYTNKFDSVDKEENTFIMTR